MQMTDAQWKKMSEIEKTYYTYEEHVLNHRVEEVKIVEDAKDGLVIYLYFDSGYSIRLGGVFTASKEDFDKQEIQDILKKTG